MSTVKASSQRSSNGRGGRIALGVVLGLFAVLIALYVADVAMNRGAVPRGTTVGGVAIGGMTPDEARETLQRELGGVEDKPVEVKAGGKRAKIVPAKAGLGIDWQATVDAAGEESLNPFTRIAGFFRTHEVDAVPAIDDARLDPALDRVRRNLAQEPKDLSLIHI